MYALLVLLDAALLVVAAVLVRRSARATEFLRVTPRALVLGILCGLMVLPFAWAWYWMDTVIPRRHALACAGEYAMSGFEAWAHELSPLSAWVFALTYCAACAATTAVWVFVGSRWGRAAGDMPAQ